MKIARLIVPIVALLALAGCTSVNTKADEAAIAYKGGPIEGTHYNKVIDPGSGLVWLGVADDYYIYPTTQRTYIVSKQSSEGDKPNADKIVATNKDGIPVDWELGVYFKLNTSKLRKFHENIGLKYKAYFPKGAEEDSAGWDTMLNDIFRQQIEATVQRVSRNHTTDEMAKGGDVYAQLNGEISSGLKDQINHVVGDNYFCGPSFAGKVAEDDGSAPCPEFEVAVKALTLPDATLKAYSDQKNADLSIVTAQKTGDANVAQAQKQAEANVAEAQGKQQANAALANIYNNPQFIAYLNALASQQCAANKDHCTMIVTTSGTGVNVNVAP